MVSFRRLPVDARFFVCVHGSGQQTKSSCTRQQHTQSLAAYTLNLVRHRSSSIAAPKTSARELVRVEIRVFWLVFCKNGLKCCEATITRATFAGLQHGRPKAYRADAARYRSRPSACCGPREVTSSRACVSHNRRVRDARRRRHVISSAQATGTAPGPTGRRPAATGWTSRGLKFATPAASRARPPV